ncbi:MAG: sigma factor-like helix-turn-helix DNA-binding protein [Anaerolineae bacterium]
MSTYAREEEVIWIMRKARTAAYSARKRFDLYDATCADLEDMTQTAALTFWRLMVEGNSPAYAFVAAREEARQCYVEQILGSGPRNLLSLDHPLNEDGDPPHERLAVSVDDEPGQRLDWLSDEVLEGVLFEARKTAGFSRRQMARYWDTIQREKWIIRLAANGHTNASIAQLMGTTEGTIRNRRQRIRRLLEHLLPPEAPPVEYSRTGGNQQRARDIQLTYPGQRKPEPAYQ